MNTTLDYYKLYDDVKDLNKATDGSVCFDVFMYSKEKEPLILERHKPLLVSTGIIFEIPMYHHLKLYERSSTCLKTSFELANKVGIVDYDYREELKIPIVQRIVDRLEIPYDEYTNRAFFQIELCKTQIFKLRKVGSRPIRLNSRSGGFGSTS